MCELTIHYSKPLSWLWRLTSLFQQIDKNCLWSVLLATMEITNVQHSSVTKNCLWSVLLATMEITNVQHSSVTTSRCRDFTITLTVFNVHFHGSLSICTLVDNSFRPISAREVAQL